LKGKERGGLTWVKAGFGPAKSTRGLQSCQTRRLPTAGKFDNYLHLRVKREGVSAEVLV
jgi:hypothetical protein